MQTLKRCAYAMASYDSNYVHDLYDEKKARLEHFCRLIVKLYKDRLIKGKNIAVSASYSKKHNIAACIYKGQLFVGFQDKETGEISFDDESGEFVKMAEQTLEQLELRMINAFDAAEKNRPFLMSDQLEEYWKQLYPLMDKLLEYEQNFKDFPIVKQKVLENSGIKDVQINDLIRKMEKELHPLIEEALEEMYGIDIGKLGKEDRFSNMTQLEEYQEELHYQTDIGSSGYINSVCSTPLFERFEKAKEASQNQTPNKNQIKEHEQSRNLTQ